MPKTVKIRVGGSKSQFKSDLKKAQKEIARGIEKQVKRELDRLK
ncbi:hypothetical protein [Paenibacillus apii]|nr:hypothetical protein [Paenibacillus apii]